MPYGITQFNLPPGRGNFPAFTPAEAGPRLSDPGEMQDWVDLGCDCNQRQFTHQRQSPISDITKQCHARIQTRDEKSRIRRPNHYTAEV